MLWSSRKPRPPMHERVRLRLVYACMFVCMYIYIFVCLYVCVYEFLLHCGVRAGRVSTMAWVVAAGSAGPTFQVAARRPPWPATCSPTWPTRTRLRVRVTCSIRYYSYTVALVTDGVNTFVRCVLRACVREHRGRRTQ